MRDSIRSLSMFCLFSLTIPVTIEAASVDLDTALRVAEQTARLRGSSATPIRSMTDETEDTALFHVIEFEPTGFVIVSEHDDLPPVIAYSFLDSFPQNAPERNILLELLRKDLGQRQERLSSLPASTIAEHHRQWDRLLSGILEVEQDRGVDQWPPAGSTATGGWLEANWHQNSPYNDQCPLDSVTGGRSVAGCPAVAMALISPSVRSLPAALRGSVPR